MAMSSRNRRHRHGHRHTCRRQCARPRQMRGHFTSIFGTMHICRILSTTSPQSTRYVCVFTVVHAEWLIKNNNNNNNRSRSSSSHIAICTEYSYIVSTMCVMAASEILFLFLFHFFIVWRERTECDPAQQTDKTKTKYDIFATTQLKCIRIRFSFVRKGSLTHMGINRYSGTRRTLCVLSHGAKLKIRRI